MENFCNVSREPICIMGQHPGRPRDGRNAVLAIRSTLCTLHGRQFLKVSTLVASNHFLIQVVSSLHSVKLHVG